MTTETLFALLDRIALESMLSPLMDGKKADGSQMTMAELANKNTMIAQNNEGIRDFVIQLKAAIKELES